MAPLALKVLGGFEIVGEAGQCLMLPTKKSQALFAYLALRADRPCSREALTALLWGDTPDLQARHSLRQAVYQIRKTLGDGRADTLIESTTFTLRRSAMEVDALTFERLLRDTTGESLEAALALYRGDLLEGLAIKEACFDDWLLVERERLRELALEALGRLLARYVKAGADEVAIQTALRLLVLDPLQEAAHRALMRLYDRQGRRTAALRQYEVCVGVLQRELHTDPEPATRSLYLQILRRQTSPPMRARCVITKSDTPFVGRALEVDRLRRAVTASSHGRGGVVLVTGEAGIGKSRLVEEVVAGVQGGVWRLLVARCHRTEQILPFRPYVEALRASEALSDSDTLQRLASPWIVELARLFPELAAHDTTPAVRSEDHLHLFEAMSQLLRSLAASRPVILVLEDLHWGDDLSLRFLGFLGRRIYNLPMLIIGTLRDEELVDAPAARLVLDELERESHCGCIQLGPLTEHETRQLTRSLLGTRTAGRLESSMTRAWSASRGNPLVVVEAVREFQQRGEWPALPERVREMAVSRVAQLDAESRHLLALIASAGQAVAFAVIACAAGSDDLKIASLVERLVRSRVLRAAADGLDFTHDRIRRAVYEDLLPAYRQVLHGALAKALEAVRGNCVEEMEDQLAHHYALAGDAYTDKAVAYLVRVAEKAAQRYALDDAIRTLRGGLAHVDRLPTAVSRSRRIDIVVQLAHVLFFAGRIRDAADILLQEAPRAQALDVLAVRARYHAALGHVYWFIDEFERAGESARRALDDAERCGDAATCGKAHYVLARERYAAGRPREGVQHGEQAIRLLETTADSWWLGQSYWILALNYAHIGEFDRALDVLPHVWRVAEQSGDRRLQAYAEWTTGWVHVATGETTVGIEACLRALELAPDTLHKASASGYLGAAYLAGRDAAQAIRCLEAALGQLESTGGFRYLLAYFTAVLAEAHLAAGRRDCAHVTAERALRLATSARWLAAVGWARRALGRIALDKGDATRALANFDTARCAFENVQAYFQAARTRLLMAEAAHRQNRLDDVAQHLGTALETFRTLRVEKYVVRTERLAARLSVVPSGTCDVVGGTSGVRAIVE